MNLLRLWIIGTGGMFLAALPPGIDGPYSEYVNLGSTGLILLLFVLSVWKGAPAVKAFADKLLETFKAEIRNEREHGQKMLTEERESRTKSEERMTAAIERNTAAIRENTEATRQLEKSVEKVLTK